MGEQSTSVLNYHPSVIIKPPTLFLVLLLAGLALDFLFPLPVPPDTVQFALGLVLIIGGVWLMAKCMRLMREVGTNLETDRPTTEIIRHGPYLHSLNPIYVAGLMLFLGIAVAVDSGWLLMMLIPFLTVLHFGVVKREEVYLEDKFGDAYTDYRDAVRRWV